MQAACDANGCFKAISAGWAGKLNDAGIFDVTWGRYLETLIEEALYIIADGAYPVGPKLLKPYNNTQHPLEHQSYNFLLSRARVTIEMAFGQLKARWRCLTKHSGLELRHLPDTANMVACCCILHNMIIKFDDKPVREVPGHLHDAFANIMMWEQAARDFWRNSVFGDAYDSAFESDSATVTGYVMTRNPALLLSSAKELQHRQEGEALRAEVDAIARISIIRREELQEAFRANALARARRYMQANGTGRVWSATAFPVIQVDEPAPEAGPAADPPDLK
jgi:hypothetical protein